jgi:HD-GYP domain-containing protein (c-di-GMP phosphodiesterase class II)
MAKIHLTGRRPHRDGINTRLDNGPKCGARMAHIMRTEGVPGTSFLVEDLSSRSQVPTTDYAPSMELSLAIAALRRGIDASAVDCTDIAELERSRELAAALAGLEETYMASGGGSFDLPSVVTAAAAAKDERAGGQLRRVCRYAMMLTAVVAPEHIGDPQFLYGFLLHDVGIVSVPDSVLATPAALTDAEWALMKGHPEFGLSLLEPVRSLEDALQIVHAHHERWDGKGYPRGLAGDEIPLGARILVLCDSFNAMTQDRPYRAASSIADARREVYRGSGGQLWPLAVDAFLGFGVSELEDVRGAAPGETEVPQPSTLRPAVASSWRPGRS